MQLQPRLDFGAVDHISNLHSKHNSYISFTSNGKRWIEHKAKPYNVAIEHAKSTKNQPDTYMAVNGFRPYSRRSVEATNSITCNYLDIDYYNMNLSKDDALNSAQGICDNIGLPYPTQVIDSGRGLYLLWILNQPVYCGSKATNFTQRKEAWAITQQYLINTFEPIGADPKCRDLSRVLRIPQTVNSKSNTGVVAYDVGDKIKDPSTLYKILAPIYQTQKKKTSRTSNPKKSKNNVHKMQWTCFHMLRSRMNDLCALAKLRGGRLKDHRAMAIFCYAVNVSGWVGDEQSLLNSVSHFIENYIDLSDGKYDPEQPARHLKTVVDRFNKTKHEKQFKDPINHNYKLQNATIIKMLDISDKEQRKLECIISKSEKERRRTAKRRKDGVKERSEYLKEHSEKASSKAERARKLYSQGMTKVAIARELQVTRRTVHNYLKV